MKILVLSIFLKLGLIKLKKKVFKIIPYFASAPCILYYIISTALYYISLNDLIPINKRFQYLTHRMTLVYKICADCWF